MSTTRLKNSTTELRDLDALHHLHPFTNHKSLRAGGARVIVKGDGPYIWDSEGKRILDGMAGLWTTNVGYGRAELADAARDQMLELPFYNTFFRTTHPPVIALSQKLAEITPPHINQVFYGSSGSESNDTAIRLIRHYWALKGEPKRRIIISRKNAYHGSTIAAGSMGGMPHVHQHSYPVYEGFRHVMDPYWFGEGKDGESLDEFGLRAAKALEDEILAVGPENVAAFAAEPVQGAGGVKIPPATYWPAVQKIIDKYGILFLADEVITGFGRLGTWFASDYYGLKPNLITFAKAVTSGYIPLSGLLIDDRIVEALMGHDDDFNHGYTFSGHPVACAVALKNLEIMEREKLVQRVNEVGAPALAKVFEKFKDHPLVGEVRTVGMLGAIELVADKRTRRRFDNPGRVGLICRDHFFREGFIMRAVFDTMVCAPPLIWGEEQFAEAERVIRKALDLTLADVAGEIAA
ncbi:aspartate aminotransferase family protein [Hyphomicrobium zavarzinii]|jgi:putrescine aminotransferase|uniref:aspartate aminotransferase family protein n=1 Tax=Hyphomicrobium zavarzinii TaxID=48292 RepID=UPI0003609BBA|nr:aspartate aminotransferase family protein [Hyphomicrobium zavarzinii]HML41362.1 aspartate aminotransferase family protein [Hyphomicrobium zavarzinii]